MAIIVTTEELNDILDIYEINEEIRNGVIDHLFYEINTYFVSVIIKASEVKNLIKHWTKLTSTQLIPFFDPDINNTSLQYKDIKLEKEILINERKNLNIEFSKYCFIDVEKKTHILENHCSKDAIIFLCKAINNILYKYLTKLNDSNNSNEILNVRNMFYENLYVFNNISDIQLIIIQLNEYKNADEKTHTNLVNNIDSCTRVLYSYLNLYLRVKYFVGKKNTLPVIKNHENNFYEKFNSDVFEDFLNAHCITLISKQIYENSEELEYITSQVLKLFIEIISPSDNYVNEDPFFYYYHILPAINPNLKREFIKNKKVTISEVTEFDSPMITPINNSINNSKNSPVEMSIANDKISINKRAKYYSNVNENLFRIVNSILTQN